MNLIKTGRLFFGLGITAFGIQQIITRDFRPEILPGFPGWVHEYAVFPIFTGIIMAFTGLIITGLFNVEEAVKRKICIYLGCYFFALLIVSHIPYLLFVYPHKLSHLGSWGQALKELAFSGGSFIVAGSFINPGYFNGEKNNPVRPFSRKLIPLGRLFFCTTIILFGCNHFVYDISGMVPKWFGMAAFWSYFAGTALIGSGVAILFKIFLKPVALLLATMLFLWFIFVHVPGAIAHPYAGAGNAIVSAFDALLFCGVALIIASTIQNSPNSAHHFSTSIQKNL